MTTTTLSSIDETDTDNDGYRDLLETANPSLGANPTDSDQPGPSAVLYDFSEIENLTTGTLKNVHSPIFLLRERIAYIEADYDFGNGTLYLKNLSDLSAPRVALETGLSAELRELGAGPLGTLLYFHKKDGGKDAIFKGDLVTRNVSKAVPGHLQSLPYGVRNPTVFADLVIQDGDIQLGPNCWLVAETDYPAPANGQLQAFRLQTSGLGIGNWDGVTTKSITAFTSGNRIARPKVSRDGTKIMFQEVLTNGSAHLYIFNGLENILNGTTNPYDYNRAHPQTELRGDRIVWGNDGTPDYAGVASPIGFNGKGNFAYWDIDMNKIYNLNNPLTFSGNFNIVASAIGMGSSGRFTAIPPGRCIIPLPGNQFSAAVSRTGMRIAFADDYIADNTAGGNFNLYVTSVYPLMRITPDMALDSFKLTDPSGLVVEASTNNQAKLDLTNAVADENFKRTTFGILTPSNPISSLDLSSALTCKRIWGPHGLITNPSSAYSPVQQDWTVEDLALPEGGAIDPTTLYPTWRNPSTGLYEPIPAEQIIEINIAGGYFKYKWMHNSESALIGQIAEIPKSPAAAKSDWSLY